MDFKDKEFHTDFNSLKESLDKLKQEQKNNPPLPIDWIHIEEALPKITVYDAFKNKKAIKYVKVKNKEGEENESIMADSKTWYYRMKEINITHWFNEG